MLLFRQSLAFTAKGVRKRSITKPKSICEANLRWILARYWNGVNSNDCIKWRGALKQYIRKIAYLFHYRNGIKGESVGYVKLSVRNGQGSLTVRLRPYRDSIEELSVCALSEGGQAEELGSIHKKEGVLEGVYLYEKDTVDKLLALSGLFLLDEEEYYGARMDGRDLTEHMVRGALSAHVQAFAEEFAKASKGGLEEMEPVFPVQDALYAAELVAATSEVCQKEEEKKEEPIKSPAFDKPKVEEPATEKWKVEEPNQVERSMQQSVPIEQIPFRWMEKQGCVLEERSKVESVQTENLGLMWEEKQECISEAERTTVQTRTDIVEQNPKELHQEIVEIPQERKEYFKEELPAEMQYELLLKQFPTYRPIEGNMLLQSVRVEPKHIKRFPKEARKLAENSFLLHSFYQYKHLVLAKKQEGEQTAYVLLVPGVFHYRDIYLAGTFGFSSFLPMREECRRRQKKQGEFGYWYLALT